MKKMFMFFFAVLIVVAGPCMSQTKSDIIPPPPGLGITEKNVDYARLWASMLEEEKELFLGGVRIGINFSRILIENIKIKAELERDIFLFRSASDVKKVLETKFFSAEHPMISVDELRIRIDLFYSKKPNKYESFYVAICKAVLDAASE